MEEGNTFEDIQSVYSRSQACSKMSLFQGHRTYCYNITEAYNSQAALKSMQSTQDTEQPGQQFNNSEQSLLDPQGDSIDFLLSSFMKR